MATSPIAASRLVARNITQTGFDAAQARFQEWIEARADSAVASDALVGALNFSKNPDKVLGEAMRIYNAAIANGDDAGAGLTQEAVESIVDEKTSTLGSKFRGEWSIGDLAFSDNFGAGLNPTYWTADSAAVGAIFNAGGNRPGYTNMVSGGGTLTLKVEQVPALAGKAVVQVKFWHAVYRYIGGANFLTENGVQKWSRSTGSDSTSPWEQETVALSDTGNLLWNGNGSNFYLTGMEVYITGQPYMLGEFVLYSGKMWKSKANNNSAAPGSTASWDEVPVTANQTYTTATRPSAATAGAGAQIFDRDLGIPVWSNGNVWRNAAGQAV